jgi:uncharacterized protein YfiM (DUF2279 family)
MIRRKNQGPAARLRGWLRRVSLLAAAGLAASTAVADEFHLFPADPASRGTLGVMSSEPSFRLVELERGSPWGGAANVTGFRSEDVSSEDPQEPPAPDAAPAPAPKKLFDTTTTLWTAAALLGGIGQGIGAPIHYGTQSWHFTNEGWFGYDTYAGGADKCSHFIVSSGVSRLLYDVYRSDGHSVDQSFNLALAATVMAGIFVETGDAITVYGWSWQDLTADFLGASSGLLIHRFCLQDMLGLRLGPADTDIPPAAVGGSVPATFGASYTNEIYAADLKLGGLITRLHGKPGIARYFMTSFVYLTKGYGYAPPLPSRYQEMGVELGIDFPAILKDVGLPDTTWWGKGIYAFFNFFRIPYTQVGAYYNFKNKKWYGPGTADHYY